jgi:hypothetical protein
LGKKEITVIFKLSKYLYKKYIMNRSYSKIRHIQESNRLLEERKLLNEVMDYDPQLSKSPKSSGGGGVAKAIGAAAAKTKEEIEKQKAAAVVAMENAVKVGGEETKKFQDWMDKKGRWVATKDSTGTTKYTHMDKEENNGYGASFEKSPSTKEAWRKYGKEYTTGEGSWINSMSMGKPEFYNALNPTTKGLGSVASSLKK